MGAEHTERIDHRIRTPLPGVLGNCFSVLVSQKEASHDEMSKVPLISHFPLIFSGV